MNAVFQVTWEELVFSLCSDLIIMLNNKLQIPRGLIVDCMEILLLSRTRYLPSENHDYLSIFQYCFEIFLNWKQGGMVCVYANNPDKERERWVVCGLVMGFIT